MNAMVNMMETSMAETMVGHIQTFVYIGMNIQKFKNRFI